MPVHALLTFGPGLVMGGAVGAGSALLLHAGIQVGLGLFVPTNLGFVITVGLPAGAFFGALCAMVGAAFARRAVAAGQPRCPPRTASSSNHLGRRSEN